jgi:tetratricopeptide (TPR) repeat protein
MKVLIKKHFLFFGLLLICSLSIVSEAQPTKKNNPKTKPTPKPSPTPSAEVDAIDRKLLDSILAVKDFNERIEQLKAFLEARPNSNFRQSVLDLISLETIRAIADLNERIEKLKTFVQENPNSALKNQALELISSARATLGDEKLKQGDSANGIELFRLAVSGSPDNSSDNFYDRVLSQIPSNLYWRNEQKAALEIAKLIEEKVKTNATRLLLLEAFYLGVEDGENALRLAQMAVTLAPELSAAHQGLGAAYRISFKLDEAADAYAKAVELDPNSAAVRRSLADIRRAQGRDEEALMLYRGLVQADKDDEFARIGLIMSLFNLNKREEAEAELKSAVEAHPNNFILLTNAAYWYAAHNEGERAVELAQKAIQKEPRYVWAHVAAARGFIATKQPLEAERVLLYAKQYGSFPTLDYELATVLASMGLYEEATKTLSRSFTIKDGMIETKLGGRATAKAAGFIELIALERRASIFQSKAADTESNSKLLKSLLAFSIALNPEGGKEARKEEEIIAAAKEFTSNDDAMKTHRQLYVASRLIQNDIALSQASEFTQSATSGVEAALDVPAVTVAVMADELYEVRARAATYGGTANVPNVPRNTLSNIMRGRIEDMAGWSLFNQNKTTEAIVRLKRAVGILPENSVWWRNAMWHLGAAHEANGNQQDALNAYFKSYNSNPDASRRAIIEGLYKKVNGTLDGLNDKIGPSPFAPSKNGTTTETTKTETAVSTNSENNQTTPAQNPIATEPKQEPTPTPEKTEENKLPVNIGPTLTIAQKTKSETVPDIKLKPIQKSEQTNPPTSLVENKTEPSASPSPSSSPETKVENKTEQTTPQTNTEIKTETPTNENKIEPTPSPSPTIETKLETKTENKTETPTEVKQEPAPTTENKQTSTPTEEKPSQPSTQQETKPSQDEVAKTETKPNETTQPTQTEKTNENKTENKTEPTPSPVNETKTETKPENVENKTETKVETKPENKTETPAEVKQEPNVSTEAKPKTEENKTETKVETTPTETPKSENKTDETAKPQTETEQKQSSQPTQEKTEPKQIRPRIVVTTNPNDESNKPKTDSNETKPNNESSNTQTKPCSFSVSQNEVSILNYGGTVAVTLTFEGMLFDEKLISTKHDWSNINVFLEKGAKTDGHSALYTITSISRKTGIFTVTFNTPCGSKEINVKVR